MTTWTIEHELYALSDADNLDVALQSLGLSHLVPVRTIHTVRDWWPSGAETYCYVFKIEGNLHEETFILKSFVPTPGTYSISEALTTSLERASDLFRHGVSVPFCYGSISGTALFAYIPHDLVTFLNHSKLDPGVRNDLIGAAEETIRRVYRADYRPVEILRDLRTDGERVYMIDFGWDLGARMEHSEQDSSLTRALESLEAAVRKSSI